MKAKTIEQNGFKKTEIGLIPEDWKAVKLGDEEYFEILSSGIDKFDNSKKYLSTSSIKWDKIIAVECDIIYKNRPLRANMQPKIDTVWFAKMKNTIKVYTFTGKNKADINEYILSTGFAGTLCNKNKAEPKYLEKVFLSTWFNRIKDTLAHGSTQKAVNNQDIKKILIPVPPLPEQQKIASVLSKIQQAIEQQDKIIQITKELKKSLMNKLFSEGLHGEEQKETEIGLMPKSWDVIELGDICEQRKESVVPDGKGENKYVGLEHMVSGETWVKSFGYDNEVRSSKFIFNEQDILYGKLRPYLDKASVTDFSGVCSTDIIVLAPNDRTMRYFIVYFLHLNKFIEYAKATTSGVNHPRTSWNSLKKFKLALSTLPEQKEIPDILLNIDKKLSQAEARKQTLQDLFKTMLNLLMTGQVRVKDLDFEVAIK